MKFLANENFPQPSIQILEEEGFEVKAIAEELPGISDEAVIKLAREEKRIILTFDKDYGELLFKYGINAPVPVIFFRHKGSDPKFAGNFLIKLLSDKNFSLENNFTVIEESNIRQRKY